MDESGWKMRVSALLSRPTGNSPESLQPMRNSPRLNDSTWTRWFFNQWTSATLGAISIWLLLSFMLLESLPKVPNLLLSKFKKNCMLINIIMNLCPKYALVRAALMNWETTMDSYNGNISIIVIGVKWKLLTMVI